jgi:hypothetical protein
MYVHRREQRQGSAQRADHGRRENWQAGERAVDANIAAGRTTHYASDEEFLAALDAVREHPDVIWRRIGGHEIFANP